MSISFFLFPTTVRMPTGGKLAAFVAFTAFTAFAASVAFTAFAAFAVFAAFVAFATFAAFAVLLIVHKTEFKQKNTQRVINSSIIEKCSS